MIIVTITIHLLLTQMKEGNIIIFIITNSKTLINDDYLNTT
jgi:hypothetical protein